MVSVTPLNPHPRPDDLHSDRERWWYSEAGKYVVEALGENLGEEQSQRIADMIRLHGDDAEIGRMVRLAVHPYLDQECERECNQ